MITEREHKGNTLLTMESGYLKVELAPGVGGRIIAIENLKNGYQYLWKNPGLDLQRLPAGSEYDPNFYGGIDELLPNDVPETIGGKELPDHGELWTMALNYEIRGESVILSGTLPVCGLQYERAIELSTDGPELKIRYRITNPTDKSIDFLWKFHAALNIREGDEIICPAETAVPAGAEWSRWKEVRPFKWPKTEGQRADIIPPKGSYMDFLYLYDLRAGYMGWQRPGADLAFMYSFDRNIFPYCWYFASYGGFFGHYTAVLEPCTAMPCSLKEASAAGQCSVLKAGETVETTVRVYAGTRSGLEL